MLSSIQNFNPAFFFAFNDSGSLRLARGGGGAPLRNPVSAIPLRVWGETSSVSTTAIAGGGHRYAFERFCIGDLPRGIPKQEANPNPKKGKAASPSLFFEQQATASTKTISDFEGINAAK